MRVGSLSIRVVSVVGAIAVGLVLGSAAVLVPMVGGGPSTPGSSSFSAPQTWLARTRSRLSASAAIVTSKIQTATSAAMQPKLAETTNAANYEPRIVRPSPFQGNNTGKLTGGQPPAGSVPTVADAKTTQTPWATQVTVEPDSASPRKLTSSKPVTEDQRRKLVADIQAELMRVGCYDGETDGQWGPGTRRAMAAFTDRVNASLPFDQPDLILLTLVQGHKSRACGLDCPVGQGHSDTGRCVPSNILARSEHSRSVQTAKSELADKPVAEKRNANERQGTIGTAWSANAPVSGLGNSEVVAGPVPAPLRVTRAASARQPIVDSLAIEPKIAVVPPTKQAAVAVNTPPALTQPTIPVDRERAFPGRMTMGAPLPPPDTASALPANEEKAARNEAGTRLAAIDSPTARAPVAAPVTAVEAEEEAAPKAAKRAAHSSSVGRQSPYAQAPAIVRRRLPEPVIVHRPAPPPRVTYVGPRQQSGSSSGSKSRRLVYEMFQRLDRN